MKIKDLPKVERPREKLEKYGPERLTNAELLAILLGSGTKGVNVIELSKKILKKFDNGTLSTTPIKELKNITGLGPSKACDIVASFELSRRLLQNKKHEPIMSPKDVWDALSDIRSQKKEHFVVFYLDARNQTIQREVISVGTINASLIHPREVFEPAIRNLASHIIMAHNHPSGELSPSREDREITDRLVQSGILLNIEIIDHIIVTATNYLSMKLEGLL